MYEQSNACCSQTKALSHNFLTAPKSVRVKYDFHTRLLGCIDISAFVFLPHTAKCSWLDIFMGKCDHLSKSTPSPPRFEPLSLSIIMSIPSSSDGEAMDYPAQPHDEGKLAIFFSPHKMQPL